MPLMTSSRIGKPLSRKKLTELYVRWQQSSQRMHMALETLTGAQAATLNAEVEFKAAARLAYGDDVEYDYDAKRGLVFKKK